jgi:pyrroline-5-carboxylate reductase
MQNVTIGFIGGGNMGQAIIGGLLASGYEAAKIWASDPQLEKLAELRAQFAINTTQDNAVVVQQADIIVLAVKPQVAKTVVSALAPTAQVKKPLIISVMAGIREARLAEWLGGQIAVVRCMPNTPALIGAGATGLHANALVTTEQKNIAESIMRSVGVTVWLSEEQQLDVVTALSGSGPAYFFRIMEVMENTGIALGLSPEVAHLLTLQTVLGAARIALESKESVVTLRQRVTSPNGTTERALKVLEEGGIANIFAQALTAAKIRSEELAE